MSLKCLAWDRDTSQSNNAASILWLFFFLRELWISHLPWWPWEPETNPKSLLWIWRFSLLCVIWSTLGTDDRRATWEDESRTRTWCEDELSSPPPKMNSSPKAVSGQRYSCPALVVCDLGWGGAGQRPRRRQSPVEHRGNLSICPSVLQSVRPPAPSSGLHLLSGLFWPKFCQIAQIQAIWP